MPPCDLSCSALVHSLRPGMRVFIHAGPAESLSFRQALLAEPDYAEGVEFIGIFIPGINDFDYASLHDQARASSSFVPPSARKSFEAGRFDFTPVHYSELGAYLESKPIDLAILHCPPDSDGYFSLGVNADVAGAAARHAARCAIVVNSALPSTLMADPLPASLAAHLVEGEGPVLTNPSEAADEPSQRIAGHVAALVRDGDTIQIGIGKLPTAILHKLLDHRDLKMHTGMITDEVAALVDAGAIAGDAGTIITGMAIGTEIVREFSRSASCRFYATSVTHDVRRIAAIDGFVSINSAVEVDLFGQVNGEIINGRQVSGIGGSSDFARGARLSQNGRAIIALPAVARGKSRIVPQLTGPVTQARTDADYVVTEYGTACLRHRSLDARAEALIAIADPVHRDGLMQAWHERRKAM
jgi:acyl-CoA hydrolase